MTGPTDGQLRAAGVQLYIDRLRAELEASFMTSRRARLVWKLAELRRRDA
jgi:hypothetical protein